MVCHRSIRNFSCSSSVVLSYLEGHNVFALLFSCKVNISKLSYIKKIKIRKIKEKEPKTLFEKSRARNSWYIMQ